MSYTIVHTDEGKRFKGTSDVKKFYTVRSSEDNREYIVIWWQNIDEMIVYDACMDRRLSAFNWHLNTAKYVCAHMDDTLIYMHAYIKYDIQNNAKFHGLSVDHINTKPTDNRLANLRLATQAQQNSNRASRSDKEKPCQELIDAGVEELPKFVRWDKGECKFIIEKHPKLLKDVAQGLRKKAMVSGSKSTKLSVLEKYQDILARLKELYYDPDFENKRNALIAEFHAICQPVRDALGLPDDTAALTTASTSSNQPVTADRKGVAGRKKLESGLPPDCGITIQMVPKYCYYKPASATRGDAFAVDRHPTLTSHDKKGMLTTSSKSVSTADKFKELLSILEQLDNGVLPPPRR